MLTFFITTNFKVLSVASFAGISWDPEIRGALTVAIAAAALMGGVWLLLATNTGVRLGSLVALAGFFGWFTIMAGAWWLFGIGYTGDRPSWQFVETVKDPAGIELVGIEDFINLPDPNCNNRQIFPPARTGWTPSAPASGCAPRAIALILEFDGPTRNSVIAELATVDKVEIKQTVVSNNALKDPSDPRFLSPEALNDEVARLVNIEEIKVDQLSLSALANVAPEIVKWAEGRNYLELEDWKLLSSAEAGEASNAASTLITGLGLFPNDSTAATPDFVILDNYQRGGKPKRKSDGVWDRVTNRITTTFQFKHPAHEVVVQARGVIPRPQVFGRAAPLSQVDPDSQTVSILLRRNLGNLRLAPALLAVGAGLIFAALALVLHVRHRRESEAEPVEVNT